MQIARRFMQGRHWKKHASFFFRKNMGFTSYLKLLARRASNFLYLLYAEVARCCLALLSGGY